MYRQQWWRVVAPAAILFVPAQLVGPGIDALTGLANHTPSVGTNVLVDLGGLLAFIVMSSCIQQLLAALQQGAVIIHVEHREPPSLRSLAHPALGARLVATDLAVLILGAVGLVLLILPGLTVMALGGIAVAVAGAERSWPVQALRRSFLLMRLHPWAAIAVMLVPATIDAVLSGFLDQLGQGPLRILVNFVVAVTLSSFAALMTAILTHRLIAAHPRS